MKTPQINTYTQNNSEFKGFDLTVTFVIDYDKLFHQISKTYNANKTLPTKYFVELTKTNILKELKFYYFTGGIERYEYDERESLTTEEELMIDHLIKQFWSEIWEDYHEQKRLNNLADFILNG